MTVIDLIIKLQQLPPDMEVMIDQTIAGSEMFKFAEVNWCDEVTTALSQDIVLLSPHEYEATEEDMTP